jgi:hypothetical protein
MSTEEQDQIHGRLLRERREGRRRVAAIEAKLREAAGAFTRAAAMLGEPEPTIEWGDRSRRSLTELPAAAALLELIEALSQEWRGLRDLDAQLERFRD